MRTTSIKIASLVALIAAACGPSGPDADDLNKPTGGTSSSGTTGVTSGKGGTGPVTAGTGGVGTAGTTGGVGTAGTTGGVGTAGAGSVGTAGTGGVGTAGTGGVGTGGNGGSATGATGGSADPVGGTGGTEPIAGSGGSGMETGGTAGADTGGTGGGGGTGGVDPYAPRTGSFKMLVYSQVCCNAFPHDSRPAGQRMLQDIGQKQGFEVTLATNESEITPEGLAKYEIVFFLNSTGDLWTSGNLRRDFETWIRNNGAYAGMHGATDSASSWAFYKELTGQYYDQHDQGVVSGTIQWTDEGLTHVTGKRDLPNPWNRQEEWYRFSSWQNWSAKPGFTILNTVTTTAGGTRPVSYVREWETIRAFYTSLGHDNAPYSDETVIKHVTAGIMWAVRREALIVP
jgi:type 1 glutamine amidotransferase